MKLVTFTPLASHSSDIRFGAQVGDQIIDLPDTARRLGVLNFPHTVLDFLKSGKAVHELGALFTKDPLTLGYAFNVKDVTFLPPIPTPGKIICVGQNYLKHIIEMGRETPKFPVIFAKYSNVLIGHGAEIPMPSKSVMLDWEGELAFVIGKTCKNVKAENAYEYIAGYAPFNDVTVRDVQRRTSQFLQGKTFDGTGPMVPALVTSDEIPDPETLNLTVRLNGEVVQHANTGEMFFKIPFLVEFLSEIMTLEPGDIISTGTPEGVGFGRDPQVFMKPGDVIEVEIEKLGTLTNTVR